MTVLKAIDFATGTDGDEMLTRTRLEPEDLLDILNGLLETGFIESDPYSESITIEAIPTTLFEVNPSYAQQLKAVMIKRF